MTAEKKPRRTRRTASGADELAALTGVPVKKVRAMIRAARPTTAAAEPGAQEPKDGPDSAPTGTD